MKKSRFDGPDSKREEDRMSNSYTDQKTEIVRVPGYKSSELGLMALFEAVRIREERERTHLSKEEHLESLGEEVRLRGQHYKYHAFEIGRALCEAKQLLAHGEFQAWVAEYFAQSYRTAASCIRVFKVCMGQPELVEYFDSSCLYIICRTSFPSDLREALFANAKGKVQINRKRLVAVAMKYRNGEIGLDHPAVQQLLRRQKDFDLKYRYCIELRAMNSLVAERQTRIAALGSRHTSQPLIKGQPGDHSDWLAPEWAERIEKTVVTFQADLHLIIRDLESEPDADVQPTAELESETVAEVNQFHFIRTKWSPASKAQQLQK
jgi:hypothetical protein